MSFRFRVWSLFQHGPNTNLPTIKLSLPDSPSHLPLRLPMRAALPVSVWECDLPYSLWCVWLVFSPPADHFPSTRVVHCLVSCSWSTLDSRLQTYTCKLREPEELVLHYCALLYVHVRLSLYIHSLIPYSRYQPAYCKLYASPHHHSHRRPASHVGLPSTWTIRFFPTDLYKSQIKSGPDSI